MKKLVLFATVAALCFWTPKAAAQEIESPWSVSFRAGAVGNVYENLQSYFEHKKAMDLITASFNLSFMYDITPVFAVRADAAWGKNAGACNSQEAGGGFYPYLFNSLNFFADAMLNVRKGNSFFVPKFYFGIGLAYTYGFEKEHEWSHDWESTHGDIPSVVTKNTVFGFRTGFLAEFLVTQEIGILLDVCAEFYTDRYNGLQPFKGDQEPYKGYAGFPFDMRGIISAGVAYHF